VPLLTWVGFRSAGFIEEAFETVQRVERGLLWAVVGLTLALAAWLWIWKRRRAQQRRAELTEAFVQPKTPVQGPPTPTGGPAPDAVVAEPADDPRSAPTPSAEGLDDPAADAIEDTEPPDEG
jgi:hypothetical protein